MKEGRRWLMVAGYAVAMAWVEAAAVYYLRRLVDRVEPYQPNPLPMMDSLGTVELAREMATLIMLFTVGMLAGWTWRARFGYMAIAFGLWDIFYYAFLKIICGWPHSLVDWDVLFLIPLPWWGPVLAPMIIAALMIGWGTLASQFKPAGGRGKLEKWAWLAGAAGIGLALYLFTADTLAFVGRNPEAIRQVLPKNFPWSWFGVGCVLMAAPLMEMARRIFQRESPDLSPTRSVTLKLKPKETEIGKKFADGPILFE
jgi:hypothetical protein